MKKRIFNSKGFFFLPLCLSLLLLAGCDLIDDLEPDHKQSVYYGPATTVGEGTARAWVRMSKTGEPIAIGVDISEAATASLPEQMTMYHVALPKQAALTPYKTVMIDWNPQGHEPPIYELPHFDVHFYMITDEERQTIPGGDQEHTPEFQANYMPPTYFSAVTSVPGMGVHWVDATSPEVTGAETFTRTFIYGAYNNNVIFYEPMITLDYLQHLPAEKPQKVAVPQPPKVQQSGYYPLSYTTTYMPLQAEFTVALTDLYHREAK